LAWVAGGLAGCDDPESQADAGVSAGQIDAGPTAARDAAPDGDEVMPIETDRPLAGLSGASLETFDRGSKLFDREFVASEGLGPLFILSRCSGCHDRAGSGPGAVQKFQVVDATTRAPITDAPEMMYGGTERPFTTAGATTPLLAPTAPRPGHQLVHSRRIGPSVTGRGYIEAVLDSEIERVAAQQATRTDGIRGRINRVTYRSQSLAGVAVPYAHNQGGIIGRFGVKARVATLDDFVGDAFQGDMGLTSPLRPEELANPDGLLDDARPGPDLTAEDILTVGAYTRTIEIPGRAGAASNPAGRAAFEAVNCAVCHVPGLRTREDFPVIELAGSYAPIYSDLLLHDMGDALADGQVEEGAGPRDWRTAPLIGLRFQKAYLHDGRAATIEVAILKHAGPGSEANDSVARFQALAPDQRAALVAFVHGL
jgi:CxxC motif-containing protein (DUF1111 family)